ncbi:MAG: DUF502 domain-containing protein [Bdellovibrionota bacterium]
MGFISRIFLKGLLALLPISLTVVLITWIASAAEAVLGTPLRSVLGDLYIPGFGVLLALILIFFVGILVNSYFTQKFFEWLEKQVERMPVIRSIYSPIKDVTQLFARKSDGSSQRVVLIPFNGVEVMGLVTRDKFLDLPEGMIKPESVAVFLPFSYGVGGITVIVPKSSVRESGLPAERAMQLAITGWVKA